MSASDSNDTFLKNPLVKQIQRVSGGVSSLTLFGLMVLTCVDVVGRVGIIADFMADYGDATEFLAIPYAPITHFIAVMTGLAGIAFACNVVRYWVRRA